MSNPSQTPASPPAPRLFDPLERTDFLRLEHAPSLKGLLRPFRGKGELELWSAQCTALRDGLMELAGQLLSQSTAYPFNLLPVVLARQTTSAGTAFLRWRNSDRSAMGESLWSDVIDRPSTPIAMVHELLAIEVQRVVINMQISLTHSIARQARECAARVAEAESIYQRRVDRGATSLKESVS